MFSNCPEYVVSFFAVARIGAIITQVNPIYVGRELEHILNDSEAETIVVHEDAYPKVSAVRDDTQLERVYSRRLRKIRISLSPSLAFIRHAGRWA